MKRQLSLILAMALAGSICACDKEAEDKKDDISENTTFETTSETTDEEQDVTSSTSAVIADQEPAETDPQIELIASKKDTWLTSGDGYSYCVTDLDHNGRLEVICATMKGTGYFTSARFFEVNEACDDLIECTLPNDDFEGFLFPDIITDEPIDVYTDGNTYTYIFDDNVVTNADESSLYTNTFSLMNTYINIYVIAEKTTRSDGSVFYSDFSRVIDENEYQAILNSPLGSQTKSSCYLGWIPATDTDDLSSLLKSSYQTFLG